MTDQPAICGVAEGDCPYVKKLKEILLQQGKQEQGDCADDCKENLAVSCQALDDFIKLYGLIPVFELDIPTLPLPPPKVTFVPVKGYYKYCSTYS